MQSPYSLPRHMSLDICQSPLGLGAGGAQFCKTVVPCSIQPASNDRRTRRNSTAKKYGTSLSFTRHGPIWSLYVVETGRIYALLDNRPGDLARISKDTTNILSQQTDERGVHAGREQNQDYQRRKSWRRNPRDDQDPNKIENCRCNEQETQQEST